MERFSLVEQTSDLKLFFKFGNTEVFMPSLFIPFTICENLVSDPCRGVWFHSVKTYQHIV